MSYGARVHVAPPHVDEERRLALLRSLCILDTPPEERFDQITRVASALFDVPIALVGLIDAERQWYKSCVGIDGTETDRSITFCSHAINRDGPMVIEDTLEDPLFADHPMVTSGLEVRFYAGVSLRPVDGLPIGTLCIVDVEPRAFGERDRLLLVDLASWAEREMGTIELARASDQLAASRAHLAAILGSVAEGVVTFGSDGTIQSINAAGEKMFGRAAVELLGRPVTDLVKERDHAAVLEQLEQRGDQLLGQEVHLTVRGIRADGTPFPMEVSANELAGSGGDAFIAVTRDISEVSQLRHRLQLVLDAAGDGVIGVDVDGLVVIANPAAAAMLGRTPQELVGVQLHDAHHRGFDGAGGGWEECPTYRTLQDGVARRSEEEIYYRSDGTPFAVQYASSPLLDDGRVTGAVIVFSDITARRQVERLKDQFVSMVSHELRTPLTSIQGSLGLVAGGVLGELPDEAHSMIGVALSNTERLVRLVNDILDLERTASGHLDLHVIDANASSLVQVALDATAGAAGMAGVDVHVDVDATPLRCDADRVVQALTNLIGNAIKFSTTGGTVRVRAELAAGTITFVVEDEGRGIPADKLDAVFERFQQVDASDRRERGGSGLGLPITRSIARQHDGDVTVASEVGVGSTFRLTIPVDHA